MENESNGNLLWMLEHMTNISTEQMPKPGDTQQKAVKVTDGTLPVPVYVLINKNDVVITDNGGTYAIAGDDVRFAINEHRATYGNPHFNDDDVRATIAAATVSAILGKNIALHRDGTMLIRVHKNATDIMSGCFYFFTIIEEVLKFDKVMVGQTQGAQA